MWHSYYETPSSWTWFHVGCWAGVYDFTNKITKIQLRWLKEVQMGGIFQWINRATSTWKYIMFLLHKISHSRCVSGKAYYVFDTYSITLTVCGGPHTLWVWCYMEQKNYIPSLISTMRRFYTFIEHHTQSVWGASHTVSVMLYGAKTLYTFSYFNHEKVLHFYRMPLSRLVSSILL